MLARRGICHVANSVDILVGNAEKRGKCSLPTLSNGKYTGRKEVYGHLVHLCCNLLRILSLQVQFILVKSNMYPHAAGALFCLPQDWMFQQHVVPGNTSRVLKNYKNVLFIFYLVTNKPPPPKKKSICLFASDAAKPLKHTKISEKIE